MYEAVYFDDFINAFRNYFNRQYKDNFSDEGLQALYDYFIEFEESYNEKVKLDVIAIACDWSEYDTAEEAAINYFDFAISDVDTVTAEEAEAEALEYLQDRTQVIEFDNGIIIQDF